MNQYRGLGVCVASVVVAGHMACSGDGSSSPSPSPSPTVAACGAGAPVAGVPTLSARLVAGGFSKPLDLKVAPGDRDRLYVVEQGGRIRIIRAGQVGTAPFLDISDRISCCGERGLLGLAFHPSFATNRRFFVNYTDAHGDTHIAEFRAPSADQADPSSERLILAVAQPFANHNGGGLAFGNDGYLYIGLGDGGSAGDPLGNGQSLSTYLGKMLRIDVNAGSPYAIPSSNPIRSQGALREIWAYGLRNPFRFSFDKTTGDLYIGDVGQSNVEEIDIGLASRMGGENYGWNITEGSACYSPSKGCVTTGITMPVQEYGHDEGCSVTGGVVYRGCRMPDLVGTYFYGDYCSAFVRSFRYAAGQVSDRRDWTKGLKGIDQISSFGTDADGEVYVVDYEGEVYQLVPAGP
jgi:glucose/arabinose dehydrogenase